MRVPTPLLVLGALLLAGAASAQAPSPAADLDAALAAVRRAGPTERAAAVEAVVALKPALPDVVARLRAGVRVPTTAGWQVRTAVDETGVGRPCHILVPASVAAAGTPAPVLVDMHGGVSRPEFIAEDEFAGYREGWAAEAETHGVILVVPPGRTDCAWWTAAGAAHVRACIREAKRLAPVDDDRIFATGFSDGGSGAYYLGLAEPDPFAGVIPLNGHPAVAAMASGRQLYPQNADLLPWWIGHTADDPLYPGPTVMPHWQAFLELGATMTLVCYPVGGHQPVYLPEQTPALMRFVTTTRREPYPARVEWRGAEPAVGRARWIELLETGPAAADPPAEPDVNVLSRPGRVQLGVTPDPQFAGPGVKIATVTDGMPAAALGLAAGDVIVAMDGAAIASLRALREALGAKRFGDAVSLRVQRDGAPEPVVVAGTIPPFTPRPVYRRERPEGWVEAMAIGNAITVRARNVRRLRVLLSPAQFDLAQPLVVTVNGVERARAAAVPDLKRLLDGYAREADAGRLYAAALDVVIPPAGG